MKKHRNLVITLYFLLIHISTFGQDFKSLILGDIELTNLIYKNKLHTQNISEKQVEVSSVDTFHIKGNVSLFKVTVKLKHIAFSSYKQSELMDFVVLQEDTSLYKIDGFMFNEIAIWSRLTPLNFSNKQIYQTFKRCTSWNIFQCRKTASLVSNRKFKINRNYSTSNILSLYTKFNKSIILDPGVYHMYMTD